jgi:hypothetical protein
MGAAISIERGKMTWLDKRLAVAVIGCVVACGGQTIGMVDGGPEAGGGDAEPPLPKLPIERVDLLVMVDNSASMGDKQEFLALALPDLAGGLLDLTTKNGPMRDMHIGVVTSSLGGGGAPDVCDPNAKITASEAPTLTKFSRHNDDKGHLINRTKPDVMNPPATGIEDPVSDALPANFLAWLPGGQPTPPVPALSDRMKLLADFQTLVRGASEFGCGLEAQMESWYRFLAQPDPYDSIVLDTGQSPAAAQLVGVDSVILQQRHDFLRPDSLLAIVVLTDEEDSWSDPMWLGGRGWITRAQNNTYSTTGQLPRGTAACTNPVDPNNPTVTGPNDPACQWCAYKGTETDPNCATNKGLLGPKEDGLNVRYTNDMKRRYGMDPQFPISRYVNALQSPSIPDRNGEHYTLDNKFSSIYLGRANCSNPIFSSNLPTDPNGELCKLGPRNGRTPDQIIFTIIGGVPWQLLTDNAGKPPADPGYASATFKPSLADADWQRILGKDPATYLDEGIDPHMIESIRPRPALPCQGGAPANCDPFNGKEWDTSTSKVGIDLQYACVFTLPTPRDCSAPPQGATCDCGGSYAGPLCDPNPNDNGNLTLQARGKAYPTIRELRVAKALGDSGVVGSICSRTLNPNSPDFGYRPVSRALGARAQAVFAAHNK